MDNSVEKLHRALVTAIAQARDGDFNRPVTVSEIYQQLLPYRAARSAVGFEMNADYEYALLRLLAGEGNFARLEPGEVRETLRSELESPNPNVGLFREFANCDVWITEPPKWVFEMVDEPDPVIPQIEEEDDAEDIEILLEDVVEEQEGPPPPAPPRPTAPPKPTTTSAIQNCVFCNGELPAGRLANFCPHCGSDQSQRPCPGCGEILEPSWRFCANCGTQITGYDSAAN
jgi:hypothetical protein